jgi:hypothetical protein
MSDATEDFSKLPADTSLTGTARQVEGMCEVKT